MRHRKVGLKLNRTPSHRNAMFRNLVTSLLKHERIRTTGAKAKELRRWVDHVITLAKRGDLHARRQALAIVREKDVVHKLFEEAADRFGSLSGGYTRIVKLGLRPGDAAPMSLIELVAVEPKKKKKTKKKKAKADAAPKKEVGDSQAAGDEKKTKSSKLTDAEVKEQKAPAKKAKAKGDAAKSATETAPKQKTAEDKTKKKAAAKAKAAQPEKKAQSTTKKEDATDTAKKKTPAALPPKDKT